MVIKKSKHRYSTYTVLIFGIIIMVSAISALTSEDLDEVCNINDSMLYKYNDTWQCADVSDIITVSNVTIINNKSVIQTTTINTTDDAFINGELVVKGKTTINNTLYTLDNAVGINTQTSGGYALKIANPGLNNYLFINPDAGTSGGLLFNDGANRGLIASSPSDDLVFYTGGVVHAMTIDSSQRVGIGETNPSSILHIEASIPEITVDNLNAFSGLVIDVNGLNQDTDKLFRLEDSNTNRFTVLRNGNVGIGTISPSYPLDIDDDVGIQARFYGATQSGTRYDTDVNNWNLIGDASPCEFRIRDVTGTSNGLTIECGVDEDTLYLDSSGNVGITTSNPSAELHINRDADHVFMRLDKGSAGASYVSDIEFYNGSTRRFSIRDFNVAAGRLGIGYDMGSGSYQVLWDMYTDKIVFDGSSIGIPVGIGDNDPDATFVVNGDGYIKENVYYNVSSWDAVSTTNGGLTELSTCLDKKWFNVSENTGSPAMRTNFTFTNVESFRNVVLCQEYTGSHDLHVSIYNYDINDFVIFNDIGQTDSINCNYKSIGGLSDSFINSGNVLIQVNHPQNGVSSHKEYVDCLRLER